MSEPTITLDELYKDLDKYREDNSHRRFQLTEEQKDFLLKCRDNPNPVSYPKMVVLWKRLGWGELNAESIRKRYLRVKEDQ